MGGLRFSKQAERNELVKIRHIHPDPRYSLIQIESYSYIDLAELSFTPSPQSALEKLERQARTVMALLAMMYTSLIWM